jgi:hypothetical protein
MIAVGIQNAKDLVVYMIFNLSCAMQSTLAVQVLSMLQSRNRVTAARQEGATRLPHATHNAHATPVAQ